MDILVNMNQNYGILITARLKSKRLKKKIIKKINDKTVIEYLISNLKKTFKSKKIVLITSKSNQDNVLTKLAKKNNIDYFCGEPKDVLKRIYDASLKFEFRNVISCTADNPLIDCEEAKNMMTFHLNKKNDLTISKGLPIGLFCYCIKVNSIKKILKNKLSNDTETWLPYFYQMKNNKVGFYNSKFRFSSKFLNKIRLTLDEKKDFELIKKVIRLVKWNKPNSKDISKLFKKYPNLIKINQSVTQRASKPAKMKN